MMFAVQRTSTKWKLGAMGLALAGSMLLVAANRVGARDVEPLENHDCIFGSWVYCYYSYYPMCHLQPDGTPCFECPDVFLNKAKCVPRPNYTCTPSEELPWNCGQKMMGVCIMSECFGSMPGPSFCTLMQCVAYPN